MRFAFEDSTADPIATSWRALEEPHGELLGILSFPVAFATGTAVLVLWLVLSPFAPAPVDAVELVFLFVLLVPLHELAHAAALSLRTRTGRTTFAFSPRRLTFRAEYDATLSRSRFVAMLLMPLIVISMLPPLAAAVLRGASMDVVLLSLINAIVSSGDVLAAILVLAQVPAGASIRRRGGATAWQLPAPDLSRTPMQSMPVGPPLR